MTDKNQRMQLISKRTYRRWWPVLVGPAFFSLACWIGSQAGTAIPAGRPANFDVQTVTPTASPVQEPTRRPATATAAVAVLSLGDAPTHTPDPNAGPALTATPTATPLPAPTEAAAVEDTATPEPTPVPTDIPATRPPPTPVVTPAPPLAGGSWDFEDAFVPWPNPYGEPCPGASVAAGWTAFVEQGQYGSSCLNENLYQPNVFSGAKSQEITFDFIAASSGVFRVAPTVPGHRYTIAAYAKSDPSLSPVQMTLGVDLTGGTVWSAESVEWFPWDSDTQNTWGLTEETVTATGPTMTIFIRGAHPQAEQGGKTVIDNVSITDLGL